MEEHIPFILHKIMDTYVLRPTLFACATTNVVFDLWMNLNGFDTFALVINFINDASWVFKHIIVGLFETPNIIGVVLAKIVKPI